MDIFSKLPGPVMFVVTRLLNRPKIPTAKAATPLPELWEEQWLSGTHHVICIGFDGEIYYETKERGTRLLIFWTLHPPQGAGIPDFHMGPINIGVFGNDICMGRFTLVDDAPEGIKFGEITEAWCVSVKVRLMGGESRALYNREFVKLLPQQMKRPVSRTSVPGVDFD